MAALLNGNDTSRLVEVLAGSTALLSHPMDEAAALPLSLSPLTVDDAATPDAGAATADLPLVSTLDSSIAPTVETLLGSVSDPVVATVDHVVANNSGDLLGLGTVLTPADGNTLELAGADGSAQPVFNATNILVKDVHAELETLSHETGTSDIVHAVTNLGETAGLGTTGVLTPAADGHTNLVTDVVNAPSTLLNDGLGTVISQVGGDLGDTLHAATGVVDALLNGADPINPLPDLISGLGSSLQTLPLLDVNGGTSAGDGGLLGGGALGGGLLNGVVGNLAGSSTGHLIDVDVGPQNTSGLDLDVLAAPGTDPAHTASINAIDVGPNGPHLADLGVLTGSGIISVPALNGTGTDSLAGNLLGGDLLGGHLLGGDIASGNTTTTPVTAPVAAPLDLSVLNHLAEAPAGGDHGILDLHNVHLV